MLMIILPDGGSGKTVEAASFLHLNITFSTGDVALDWGIWAEMYTVSDDLGRSYFFLSRSVYAAFESEQMKREKRKGLDLIHFE